MGKHLTFTYFTVSVIKIHHIKKFDKSVAVHNNNDEISPHSLT